MSNSRRRLLVGTALAALLAGVWVISASGPDVFRGTLGARLDVVFRPIFGLVHLTDPVEITNTRFIVGYNGAGRPVPGGDLLLRRAAARTPATRADDALLARC